MFATTLTAITPFQVILFRKNNVAFRGEVIILRIKLFVDGHRLTKFHFDKPVNAKNLSQKIYANLPIPVRLTKLRFAPCCYHSQKPHFNLFSWNLFWPLMFNCRCSGMTFHTLFLQEINGEN